MKITKQELIEMDACPSGLGRFLIQTSNTNEPVDVASLIGGENNVLDLAWLAARKLPLARVVRFAKDCALVNLDLLEDVVKSYRAVRCFLESRHDEDFFAPAAIHGLTAKESSIAVLCRSISHKHGTTVLRAKCSIVGAGSLRSPNCVIVEAKPMAMGTNGRIKAALCVGHATDVAVYAYDNDAVQTFAGDLGHCAHHASTVSEDSMAKVHQLFRDMFNEVD